MLVVIPGLIALVGLASLLHFAEIRSTVQHLVEMLSPGPSGKLLTEAAAQGASGGATAAIVGLVAALIAGMFAVAQVERSANRLSGLDHDRPTAKRYGLAFLLAIPVGILLSAGVVLIGAGGPVVDGLGLEGGARVVWEVARWPLGLLVAAAGIMLLLRVAPVRRLGSTRHLMAGTAIAVVLWGVFTGLLSLYFALSNSTSQTYGPAARRDRAVAVGGSHVARPASRDHGLRRTRTLTGSATRAVRAVPNHRPSRRETSTSIPKHPARCSRVSASSIGPELTRHPSRSSAAWVADGGISSR